MHSATLWGFGFGAPADTTIIVAFNVGSSNSMGKHVTVKN